MRIWEAAARFVAGRRTKWLVLAFWVMVAAGSLLPAARLESVTTNDQKGFLPEGADSYRVIQLQERISGEEIVPA
ncbi:MAG TPA: hypothetical protein VFE20_00235, partial [Thermoleophilia bacterium]|nr:hypothetical protein [Thermoleophilia bacterium]